MGMFRSNHDEFLLCYDGRWFPVQTDLHTIIPFTEFGLYVDKHGYLSRSAQTFEWEGTANHVALHCPYILLFESSFIEIRHVETGRLVQMILGPEMHCSWDGRGLNAVSADKPIQETRIHGVMNGPTKVDLGEGMGVISRHVFELNPTIPLHLPSSPSSSVNVLPAVDITPTASAFTVRIT